MSAHLPGGSLFSVAVIFEVICCGGCCIFPSHKNQIETGFLLSFSRSSSLSLTLPHARLYVYVCIWCKNHNSEIEFCVSCIKSVHKCAHIRT